MKRLLVPLTIGFALAVSASGQADKTKRDQGSGQDNQAGSKI